MGLLHGAIRMGILWLLSLLVAAAGLETARWMVMATDRKAAADAEHQRGSTVFVVDQAVAPSRAARF